VGTGAAVTVGTSVAGALPGQSATSAYAKAAAINAADISGLTASASTTATEATAFSSRGHQRAGNHGGAGDLRLGDQRREHLLAAGNVCGGSSRLTATKCLADQPVFFAGRQRHGVSVQAGKLTLTAADGSDIAVKQTVAGGAGGTFPAAAGLGIDTSISGGVGRQPTQLRDR
jgi:flagellin